MKFRYWQIRTRFFQDMRYHTLDEYVVYKEDEKNELRRFEVWLKDCNFNEFVANLEKLGIEIAKENRQDVLRELLDTLRTFPAFDDSNFTEVHRTLAEAKEKKENLEKMRMLGDRK